MTYDLLFIRRRSGMTLLEAFDERAAGYDPDAELALMSVNEEQRAVWERIMQRITTSIGPVTSEEYPYSLTLWRDGAAGHLQLDYDGDSASVEIPYRYSGEGALSMATEAYRIAHIVEEESGLTGFDFQTDRPTTPGDVRRAAARLGGITDWAQENLTGGGGAGQQ
ncbi:hypothetical protein AB0C61_14340 [Streptomyces sp. NPDC048680]|uniref:hypothetical protein n=1 Tax=Streptomyces sp. NPDC048680 TaxID=3155492 RepID=UPI00341ECFB4